MMVLSKNDKVRQGQTGVNKRVKIFAVSYKKYGVDYGNNFYPFLAGLFHIPLPVL